jgi:hypothetical protein
MDTEMRDLVPAIKLLLEHRIAIATEQVIRAATVDFEQALRKSIATSALEVAAFYDLEVNQRGIVITVKDARKEV